LSISPDDLRAPQAKASSFIAGCMSDRYISVVTRDIVRLVHVVDLLAEVAQADARGRGCVATNWQDSPQRLVLS
jgi:hypothetical protein